MSIDKQLDRNPYINEKPEVSFCVTEDNDVFDYNSTFNKIARVAWLIFSIIIFPIGFIRLIGKVINHLVTKNTLFPKHLRDLKKLDIERAQYMTEHADRSERITIKTADRIDLDTIMIYNPYQNDKKIDERKYIIFFNRVESTYERMLPSLMKISDETGANVYCGNYRGVGHSKGFPTDIQDLVMDGEAMVQYLLTQGVSQKNILIHGWSIGGGVGAYVAALHQEKGKEIKFCSDRSFASTVEEIKEFARAKINEIRRENRCKAKIKASGLAILSSLALGLIRVLGWNFNSLKSYNAINGYKFIIYHPQDPEVPYAASLYKRLKDDTIRLKDDTIKLKDRMQKAKRKILKAKFIVEGGNKPEKIEQNYRPKNVRLGNEIDKEHIHKINIDETEQFENYKNHVALAFGI